MMRTTRQTLLAALCVAVVGVSSVLSACDLFNTDEPNANRAPNVELANIPVPGDTTFALATVHWDGGDQDGFISGYEYRYRSLYFRSDGSVDSTGWKPEGEDGWRQTDQTSLRIAFDSQAQINKQIFQVRAIDNTGQTSDAADKKFFTRRTVPPTTDIATPNNNSQRFAQNEVTDWWRGIPVTFSGQPGASTETGGDSRITEFGWRVDGGDFTFTEDTSIVIPPEAFTRNASSLEGEHTIQITARNNTNLLAHRGEGGDERADRITIDLIEPSLDDGILIVDETDESLGGQPPSASDEEVDEFYQNVFEPARMWDYFEQGGPPSRELMGQYDLVLWHADNYFATGNNLHQLPQHTGLLSDYMDVGGDFIMSGWRMLASFSDGGIKLYPERTRYEDDSFIRQYLHIRSVYETPSAAPFQGGDFKGVKTCPGPPSSCSEGGPYSNARVDSSRLAGLSAYLGYLDRIDAIPTERDAPSGTASFTEPIFYYWRRDLDTYGSDDDRTVEGGIRFQAVGARYNGTVFDSIVLGFPMYFIQEDAAREMAQEMLSELGHR
jgi:hypothetical protein